MHELKSQVNGLNHKYELLITKEEIEKKIEKKLLELGKTMKMPGFRPGHVPFEFLVKNYGDSVRKDVVVDAIKDATSELIMEKKLKTSLQPSAKIIEDSDDGIKVSISFDVFPEFELIEFKDLNIKRYKVKIDDEKIDEFIADVLKNNKQWIEEGADYISKKGDKVQINILTSGNKKNKHSSGDIDIILEDGRFIDGFWNNLVGLKAEDRKEFSVEIENEKKSISYKVHVKKVFSPKDFELDDEFAKFLNLDSKDKIRDWAADMLRREYLAQVNDLEKKQLLDIMSGMYNFEVPNGMVELEEREILRQIESEAEKGNKKLSQKKMLSIKEECHGIAIRRVQLGLVVAKLAIKNKVSVDPKEVEELMISIARMHPGREREIFKKYYEDKNILSAVTGPLLEEKVIKLIIDKYAKVKEVEITKEELDKIDNDFFDCYEDDDSEHLEQQETICNDSDELKNDKKKRSTEQKSTKKKKNEISE